MKCAVELQSNCQFGGFQNDWIANCPRGFSCIAFFKVWCWNIKFNDLENVIPIEQMAYQMDELSAIYVTPVA